MTVRRTSRRAAAASLAFAVTVAIGWLSQVPYAAESGELALLRLSWRIRGAKVQECRELREEERRQLPPHMQLEEVCEGRVAPYYLHLVIDDAETVSDTVYAEGARQDRPIYVYRELWLPPGEHELRLRFRRLAGDRAEEPKSGRAAPAALELQSNIALAPGAIALVTYDAEHARLVVRGAVR